MSESGIFKTAVKLPLDERAAYLDQACNGNAALRHEIESLLSAHAASDSLLPDDSSGMQATRHYQPVLEGAGTVIGPYKLLQQIGEGGMGIVYMAEQQEPVRRKVALKIIKPGMDSSQVIARFEAERQALAMMDHQNIAKVFDAGTTETGRPYFVMELVHGIPLTAFCDENRLTLRQRLELFIPVCHAIQHAHQKGIIHRDIKPSNVLVTMYDDRPVPKVIDFGIAKATDQQLTERTMFTQFGAMVGTFEYMSPEQAEMNAFGVDTRSDIYSLGVLLYELLTGTTPLEKARLREAAFNEMVRLIKEEEPPRPSLRLSRSATAASVAAARKSEPQQLSKLVRGDLDWIVMRCLEKQRDRRYETANSLARDIQRYLTDEPIEARPPSAGYRMQKFVRRNKGRVVAASLVLLALVGGIVGTTWGLLSARHARDAAETQRIVAESEKDQKEQARKQAEDQRQRADTKAAEALAEKKIAVQQEAAARAEKLRADLEAKKAVAEKETAKRNAAEALKEKARADQNAAEAQNEEERAEKELRRSEWLLYANQIASAQRAWDTNDLAGSWEHLKACRPGFRGWEFYYLYSRFMQNQATFTARSAVASVAFSPDGTRISSGGQGGLQAWSLAENRAVLEIGVKTNPVLWPGVFCVAFSPDGKRIVCGGLGGALSIRDAATGHELLRLKKQGNIVGDVAFSPDGKRILSASLDKTVKVWNALTGDEQLSLPDQSSYGLKAAFSPDGRQIATNDAEAIRFWDATTGRKLREISCDGRSAVFSPDGKRIAACASSDGKTTIKMWDAETGQEILAFKEYTVGLITTTMAFDPVGKRLASAGTDGLVKIWDATDGRKTLELKGHVFPVKCLAFSNDGKLLASGGMDGMVKIWDPAARQETVTLKGACFTANFSPDGKLIVSDLVAAGKGGACVWDAATGKQVRVLQGGGGQLRDVAYVPDGKRIVGGFLDGSVRFWDPATGKEVTSLKGPAANAMTGIRFSPDGARIASPSNDGGVTLWGPAYGKRTIALKARGDTFDMLNSAVHVAAGSKATFPRNPMVVAFSPDGKRIAGGNLGFGTITIWDAATGQAIITLGKGQILEAMSLAFSPDGKRLVVGTSGLLSHLPLSVWDAATGEQILALIVHSGGERALLDAVTSVAYSPDGKRIASGDVEGVLKIWEAAAGQETLTLKAHAGQIRCLAFSRDGKWLLSAGTDGTLKVWDASHAPEAGWKQTNNRFPSWY